MQTINICEVNMTYNVKCFLSSEMGGTRPYETTVEAKDAQEVRKVLKKKCRGYIIHDVTITEVTPAVDDFDTFERERCDKCNTPLNDGGTCPVCDDGEEDYYGQLTEASKAPVTPQQFWELVCSARDKEVREILTNGRAPAELYTAFGRKHSYLMGAIRNGNWTTARLLLTFGVKFAPYEAEELAERLIAINEG